MKYAAFLVSVFLFTTLHAQVIYNFQQSNAIQTVISALSENAEDLPNSYRVSDKKFLVEDISHCLSVPASNALMSFKTAMDSLLRIFPDEEIPYEEALNDMRDYLGVDPLIVCKYLHSDELRTIITLYYFDKSDKIHLRVDNIVQH